MTKVKLKRNEPEEPSNEHIIKLLSPGENEWKLLEIPKADEDEELKKEIRKNQQFFHDNLLSALQIPNLIILAGSGTSLGEVKGPSMSDLWDKTTKQKVTFEYEEDGELEKLEIEPNEIIKKVKYDPADKNIEALLTKCESYLQVEYDLNVEGFLIEAKKIILDACSTFLKDENLVGHRVFLHRLSKRRVRDPRLKIFTTNYDLCFERAAALQGLIILDGFSFVHPRRYDPNFFNYDIVRRSQKSDDSTNFLEGVVQLFKLHGSVNWERNNNEVREKTEPKPENACIIYPAQGKYQQSYIQPHLELFSQYLSSLRNPNSCLIISGFGFNDDHLSEPIISAIDTNPHLKIIIADYKAEELLKTGNKYWQKLKKRAENGEDVWFLNASFKELAERIPDLKALTSAQKLEKAIKEVSS